MSQLQTGYLDMLCVLKYITQCWLYYFIFYLIHLGGFYFKMYKFNILHMYHIITVNYNDAWYVWMWTIITDFVWLYKAGWTCLTMKTKIVQLFVSRKTSLYVSILNIAIFYLQLPIITCLKCNSIQLHSVIMYTGIAGLLFQSLNVLLQY